MSKPASKSMIGGENELREHYDFDYSKAKPNRFAEQIQQDSLMIVLDPDVATVFPTAKSVNDTLRAIAAVLETMPTARPRRLRKQDAVPDNTMSVTSLAG